MKTLRYSMTASLLLCFAAIACGPTDAEDSVDTNAGAVTNQGDGSDGCTLTQGYWKNHPTSWPTTSLTIGGVTYSEAELITLFNTAPKGDASLILGHQLIAARLNIASGAKAPPAVADALAAAETWMASHKDADGKLPYGVKSGDAAAQAVSLASTLDAFNQGNIGPGHCGDGGSGSGGAGGGSTSSVSVSSSVSTGGTTTSSSSTGGGTTTSSSSTGGSTTTSSSSTGGGSGCAMGSQACGPNIDVLCPSGSSCVAGCCVAIPL